MPPTTQVSATLAVFSGRPNPQWTLSTADAQSLVDALSALKPSAEPPSSEFDDFGGYQGVFITLAPPLPGFGSIRLFNGQAVVDGKAFDDPANTVAIKVLNNSPVLPQVGMTAAELVQFSISEQLIHKIVGKSIGWKVKGSPSFPKRPELWMKPGNNCYSYANNTRNKEDRFDGAQPGGPKTPKFTRKSLLAAAKHDGLKYLGRRLKKGQLPGKGAHFIAILLLYGRAHKKGKASDYHCLRLDANGVWSHKMGNTGRPTRLDAKLHLMKYLDQVLLLFYAELVGFFKSAKSTRKITFSKGL